MKAHSKKRVDVLALALPAPNPAWTGISARTNSGASVLRLKPPPTASEVSRARSELFGRLRPRQLWGMLGGTEAGGLGGPAEGGGAAGESILAASLAARAEPVLASLAASASASPPRAAGAAEGGGGGGAPPEVLVLDIRPLEAAEAFAAVRIAGALHVPFSLYMTQDRLPAAMHAARRQTPQPVIVLYDDCTGRALDGADFAGKLIEAGRFDAVMLLEGGLRAAAMEEPRLVEGSRALDYVSGVRAEVRRGQGGHGLRSSAAAAAASSSSSSSVSGAAGAGGRGEAGGSPTSAFLGRALERGSQASASSARSVGSFGSSRRF